MPRGRKPGVHIPRRAIRIMRRALKLRGDAIAKGEMQTGTKPPRPWGLERIAEVHGVNHSHLCRCLPSDGVPNRRPSYALAVGLLDECPADVRARVLEVAEMNEEDELADAVRDAASGALRPRTVPEVAVLA